MLLLWEYQMSTIVPTLEHTIVYEWKVIWLVGLLYKQFTCNNMSTDFCKSYDGLWKYISEICLLFNSIMWKNPTFRYSPGCVTTVQGILYFFNNAHNFLCNIVFQFWLSTILINTNESCHQKLTYETKLSTNRFCLPIRHQQIVQLICSKGSFEGSIKTIINCYNKFMKLLLNSTCPMIHSSIIIVYI
jgi:hypothetical protein